MLGCNRPAAVAIGLALLLNAAWASSAPQCELKYHHIVKRITSGGPGKDGIPALTNPEYVSAGRARLQDDDLVFGLDYGGFVAAYPHRIMVWHEIVNQDIAGQRVSITYCPLTRSPIAFVGHRFGVTGKLYNSNLVMYHRGNDSLIPQMLSLAVTGPLCGQRLQYVPLAATTWQRWRSKHPASRVLGRQTGFGRNYDRDPYGGYYTSRVVYFPVRAQSDKLHPKAVVLGLWHQGQAAAVLKKGFAQRHPKGLTIKMGRREVRLVWDPQLARIKVQPAVLHFEAFWFAWNAYYPQGRLYR